MTFASDQQRKWFFATLGDGSSTDSDSSGGGSSGGFSGGAGGGSADVGEGFVRMTHDEVMAANRARNDGRINRND